MSQNNSKCDKCPSPADYVASYQYCNCVEIMNICGECLSEFEKNNPHLMVVKYEHTEKMNSILRNFYLSTNKGGAPILSELGQGGESLYPKYGSTQYQQSQQKTILDRHADNLNALAENGELSILVGREKEIRRIQQILCRKTKNNPILLGESGVGKSAIIEGLAQRIVEKKVPAKLQNKKIYSLNLTSLISGTKYRGDFEEKAQKIIEYMLENDDIILFIDEIHTIVGAGASEGSAGDIGQILKPYLSRGKIKIIGATTTDEYRRHIEKDKALERRFSTIMVKEPTKEETVLILNGVKEKYETFHGVKITQEAIDSAVSMSCRYINDRKLPDKAIDLIDEACSDASLKSEIKISDTYKSVKEELEYLAKQNEKMMQEQNVEELEKIRQRKAEIKKIIENIKSELDTVVNGVEPKQLVEIKKENIAAVINLWTGIPVTDLSKDEKSKFVNIENEYKKYIVGQDNAVKALSNAFKTSITDIKNPLLPMGAFIFAGPSGVGKTHLAKVTAKLVFSSYDNMIRLDMSEYMEQHTVAKLIGSPPGYVGYDDSDRLCEPIRKNPYQVVLFDEIEKAHPDVFNILLQLLDEGHVTNSRGVKVDFKNTIIIMTTNLGTMAKTQKTLGFVDSKNAKNSKYEKLKSSINEALNHHFRPEFLNRVDESIVFEPLTTEDLRGVVDLLLENIRERLNDKGIGFEITEAAKDGLIKNGFNEAFGARPLRRAIKTEIETPIAIEFLEDKFVEGDTVLVDYSDCFIFRKKEDGI